MDPFAMALAAQFSAAGSVAAVYHPTDGAPVPVRVIPSRPDEGFDVGRGKVVQSTSMFEVQRSEVEQPKAGDRLLVGSEWFKLFGAPALDVEGLSWRCPAEALR